jgi:hypothetical protein
MLSVVMLSVVVLKFAVLSVIMLNVTYKTIMLSVVRPNVVMLRVVAPIRGEIGARDIFLASSEASSSSAFTFPVWESFQVHLRRIMTSPNYDFVKL